MARVRLRTLRARQLHWRGSQAGAGRRDGPDPAWNSQARARPEVHPWAVQRRHVLLSGDHAAAGEHDVHSNTKVGASLPLKDMFKSEGHTVVDLGDDVFTRGRPHPDDRLSAAHRTHRPGGQRSGNWPYCCSTSFSASAPMRTPPPSSCLRSSPRARSPNRRAAPSSASVTSAEPRAILRASPRRPRRCRVPG